MSKTFNFFRLYIIFSYHTITIIYLQIIIFAAACTLFTTVHQYKNINKIAASFYTLAPIWMCLRMQLSVKIVPINIRHQYYMNGVNLLSHEHQYYTRIFLSAIKSMKIALACMWSSPQKGQRRWKHNFFNHVISSLFATKMNYFT